MVNDVKNEGSPKWENFHFFNPSLISSFVVAVVIEVFKFLRSANFLDFLLHLDLPLGGVPVAGCHER